MTNVTGSSEETDLPPLKHIWECPYIEHCIVRENKLGWICKWCNKTFFPRHATRVLNHLLKISKGDISVCKAAIETAYLKRYRVLYEGNTQRVDNRKRSKALAEDHVTIQQDAAVDQILASNNKKTSGKVVSYLSSYFGTLTDTSFFVAC
jgi:hypothetical protein